MQGLRLRCDGLYVARNGYYQAGLAHDRVCEFLRHRKKVLFLLALSLVLQAFFLKPSGFKDVVIFGHDLIMRGS